MGSGRPSGQDRHGPAGGAVDRGLALNGEHGDTKTKKSRRTLALPTLSVAALRSHLDLQETERQRAGEKWEEHGLVFANLVGTELLTGNVRRAFRVIVDVPVCGLAEPG